MKKYSIAGLLIIMFSFVFIIGSCNIFKPKTQEKDNTGENINTGSLRNRTLKDIRFGSLRLGKYVYKATIEKKEGVEEAKVFREIKYQFGNLVLTEDIYTPTVKTSDKYVLDSNSLLPMFRNMTIGIDEVVNINFSGKNVEGFIVLSSGKSPFKINIADPVLSDGFSLDIALTLLPLEPGYKLNLSYFDYRIEDIRNVNIEVANVENVKTQNGVIPCHRVVVTDNDNGTFDSYWISNKDYPVITKSEVGMLYDNKTRMKKLELLEVY
jgi:hypothetical protein